MDATNVNEQRRRLNKMFQNPIKTAGEVSESNILIICSIAGFTCHRDGQVSSVIYGDMDDETGSCASKHEDDEEDMTHSISETILLSLVQDETRLRVFSIPTKPELLEKLNFILDFA